jgi:hypothetical protein
MIDSELPTVPGQPESRNPKGRSAPYDLAIDHVRQIVSLTHGTQHHTLHGRWRSRLSLPQNDAQPRLHSEGMHLPSEQLFVRQHLQL